MENMSNFSSKESSLSSVVHLLPFSIEYDGNAPIKSFFQIKEDKNHILYSHFRGRELKGKNVQLNKANDDTECTTSSSSSASSSSQPSQSQGTDSFHTSQASRESIDDKKTGMIYIDKTGVLYVYR